MSKQQRSTPSDSALPYRIQLDHKNMVLLRAADKELFLVDINCAMVSRRCHKYLKEERVKSDVVQLAVQEMKSSEECSTSDGVASDQKEVIGSIAYPVIDLPDIASDVLDLAIGFMYNKYKLDVDSEKQLAHQPKWCHSSAAKLIAASVLLEM
ncbi:unnamed protein product [Phytomonas sp. EM1]|nr:unnamed protein product [Phytomonas sp. EM1]|eukprot:CCW60174.1 unnamed protein product [Phytomonas sp. isolate EM1]